MVRSLNITADDPAPSTDEQKSMSWKTNQQICEKLADDADQLDISGDIMQAHVDTRLDVALFGRILDAAATTAAGSPYGATNVGSIKWDDLYAAKDEAANNSPEKRAYDLLNGGEGAWTTIPLIAGDSLFFRVMWEHNPATAEATADDLETKRTFGVTITLT